MEHGFFQKYKMPLIAVLLLACTFFLSMRLGGAAPAAGDPPSSFASSSDGSGSPADSSSRPSVSVPAGKDEMRAVWVPYMSLAMSGEADQSEAAFQKKFDAIVTGAKEKGLNTLVVHVRPFGDALYPSELFPWSHILTGTQGVNPGYDPLEYMVSATHKAGLKFHAWVNPLRIQSSGTPSVIAQSNPYHRWKAETDKSGWTVDLDSGKYYNPAYPQVRQLIADGVKEIVEKYDVDGVQFDDYFYPTESTVFDTGSYGAYVAQAQKNGQALGLTEWRQANINELVSRTYREMKSVKPNVVFGISPQGNVQNDLKMGADVLSWCRADGYLDYICPQLYYNFENPVLPFDTGAKQWQELVTNPNVKLYYGLALYKAGSDVDDGTWKKSSDILTKQVELGRSAGADGFMFYSWDYFNSDQTKEEVQNVIKLLN